MAQLLARKSNECFGYVERFEAAGETLSMYTACDGVYVRPASHPDFRGFSCGKRRQKA